MKHSLLLSLLLFVCLGVFGQVPPQKITLDQLQTTVVSQQATIEILQDSIWNQQMQINNLREKVDTYQKLVSDTTSNMHDDLSDFYSKMIGVLSLIGLVLGVAAPLYFNYRNEKNMEKLLEDAKDKADNAKKALNDLQPKVEKAEGVVTTIEGLKGNVDEAANKAKAIQYFIQALQENDPDRAIGLYTDCITQDPEFAEAYNNRGYLRYRKGGMDDDAKQDFENAIAKKKKFAEAYNNLGIVLFSQKNYDNANENYDDAEKNFNLAGEYAEALLNLGLLKFAKGDKDNAEEYFHKTIKLKPNFAEAYYISGLFYLSSTWTTGLGIENIIKAKYYMADVTEAYPNQNLLTREMKEWDNSFNGVEYSRDFTKLINVPEVKQGIFKIPKSVTEIGDNAFWNCSNITSIVIHDSVTVIAGYALADCSSLTSILIPDSVTVIGDCAFFGCSNLTSIEIPDSVTEIGGGAFEGCSSLTSIEIPDSVTGIRESFFRDCSSLTSILIPESVTEIGLLAFAGCSSLTSILIPDSVTVIGDHAFWGCSSLTEIHLKHISPVDFSKAFMNIDSKIMLDLSKISLYVPKGSVEAYRNHEFYSQFKEIIGE